MVQLAGFLYNDAGTAINGATINIYARNTTTNATTNTTTNSSGYWQVTGVAEGRYDVEVVNGSSKRRVKYDTELQLERIEIATLQLRNPADTFVYDIVPGAIAANRTLNLPVLTGTDTVAVLDLAQTFTNKTLTAPTIGATEWTNATHTHAATNTGGTVAHSVTTGQTANDHHTQSHNHSASGDGTSLSPATLVFPGAATPAQTADGSVVWDTDDDLLTIGDGSSRKTIVDTTATQTLTNKTLTTPTIANFANATHAHSSANSAGQINHVSLSSIGANDHHTQSHNHSASGDGNELDPVSLLLPTTVSGNPTTEGDVLWDTDDDLLKIGTGGATKTMVDTNSAQTLTNKTLTAPIIATIVNTGTLTLPTATDTLVARTTTDTLTNKTLTAPAIADFTSATHTHAATNTGGTVALSATTVAGGTDGYVLRQASANTFAWEVDTVGINFLIDGGGDAITVGVKGFIEVPFAGTITGWTIMGDQTGNIVVDVWKDAYANFAPVDADSIAGTELPTLASAQANQDLSLSSWTTNIVAGDILAFNVDSASTVTRVTVALRVNKT